MHLSKVIIILVTVSNPIVGAFPTLNSESIRAKTIDERAYERVEIGKIREKREAESNDADAAYGLYEREAESTDADAAYGLYEE